MKLAVLLLGLCGWANAGDIDSALPVTISSGSKTAGITDGRLDVNASFSATTIGLSSGAATVSVTNGRLDTAASQYGQWNVLTIATATYSAATIAFTPPATPTDIFTITGSSSKTIRIKVIRFYMTETNASVTTVVLLKRSTANSGGTSIAATAVRLDSNSPAATATILAYTANPTLGTLVGNILAAKFRTPASAPLATGDVEFNNPLYESSVGRGEIVLRGTSEVLAINLNGVTHAGNTVSGSIEWTEN